MDYLECLSPLYTIRTLIMTWTGLDAARYKSSSGDEIPERDVTYHLICLPIDH